MLGFGYLRYNEGWWLKQRTGRGLVDSPRPPIRRDLAGNPRPCNLPSAEGGLHHGEREFAHPCRRGTRRTKDGQGVSSPGLRWRRRLLLRSFRAVPVPTPICHCLYLCLLPSVFVFRGKRLENGELGTSRKMEEEGREETIFIDSPNNRTILCSIFTVRTIIRGREEEKEREKTFRK